MKTKTRLTRGTFVAGFVAAAMLLTSCIEGPLTGTASLPIGIDPAGVGYQQSEFFLSEKADAYTPVVPGSPLSSDGKWDIKVDAANSGVLFKTRLVVLRPVNPAKFNGTVIVEWLNVTAGIDLANDWVSAHNEIVRSGAMWVGVSAQAVGVNSLKTTAASADRYKNLAHPGDSYSYDIFTKAAQAIRTEARVTGGLTPARLIATGQSQSASRLVTYINAIQPLTNAFDGFLVHSRGSSGAPLSQSPLATVSTPSTTFIRDDMPKPVFVVQAEDDVVRSNLSIRQPDTATFRMWELAGTAHADVYMSGVGFSDPNDGSGATRMVGLLRNPGTAPPGCTSPINAGGLHWTLQAAFNKLDIWMRTGTAPAVGPLLLADSTSPTVLSRDALGNALGGVRSVQVEVPVARVDGINAGSGFCRLFGSTTPFTTTQLLALYPTKQDFVNQWSAALDDLVAGGFLLRVDADELLAAAQASTIPN